MNYNQEFFDFKFDRYDTKNIKWDKPSLDLNNKDIVPLWIADMDFRTPTEVSEALIKRANHPSYGYSYLCDDDKRVFLDYYRRHHNIEIQLDQFTTLPSVVSGLKLIVRTLSNEKDPVVIQTPVYGPFMSSIELNNRQILENRLISDTNNRYSMDLNGLEDIFKKGAKLFILCNPHNPVSRYWNEKELIELLKLAKKYEVTLVSDEIHADFVYAPNKFVSMMKLAKEFDYDKVICLHAPSKTFNVAGMKFSLLMTRNKEFLDKINSEMERCGVDSQNIFGIYCAISCYKFGDQWRQELIKYLDKSRKILTEEIAKINNAVLTPIEATYLAWLDLRKYNMSSEELVKKCENERVILTPGTAFSNTIGDGFLRINFACPHTELFEGVNRLKKALHK